MEYRVVKVIDYQTVAINAGRECVDVRDVFTIYGYDKETTKDPETGEDLGHLYYPKGRGKIIDVQEKMSILRSCEFEDKTKRETKEPSFNRFLLTGMESPKTIEYTERIRKPFDNPQIGDIVK